MVAKISSEKWSILLAGGWCYNSVQHKLQVKKEKKSEHTTTAPHHEESDPGTEPVTGLAQPTNVTIESIRTIDTGDLCLTRERARILVQVTIYRRLRIGRDGHLDQSEAHDIS